MPTTEVILVENIPGLGAEADIVKVRAGYARNFLVPSGKAHEVTPSTMKQMNQLKAKRAAREATELNEAEDVSRKINKLKLTLLLETGETGKAFGSITASDIAEKLKADSGIEIDRHSIQLERPIKESGEHEIEIKLHHGVTAKLQLTVKSKAEAETKSEGGAEPLAEGEFKSKAKARHTK